MGDRYETYIEDGTVYVEADIGRVEVGPYQDLLNHFGEEHEITYRDWEKERYDISFADEGMQVPVRQTVETMTHSEEAVQGLRKKSPDPEPDSYFEGGLRMALFVGFVSDALENNPI